MAFDFSYPNTPADQRGWGPGWPNCQTDKVVPLTIRGVPFPGGVRKEIQELCEILLEECLQRRYITNYMEPGCWGGACRDTKRSDGTHTGIPSNHSWYLAIDINAPRNVFGGSTHEIPAEMAAFLREYGFRWLGPPIGDWMHFDFCGTPADAREMTEKARLLLKDERLDDLRDGARAYWAGEPNNPNWPIFKVFGHNMARRGDVNPRPGDHEHDELAAKVHDHPGKADKNHPHTIT